MKKYDVIDFLSKTKEPAEIFAFLENLLHDEPGQHDYFLEILFQNSRSDVIQYFINNNSALLRRADRQGQNALHYAVKYQNLYLFRNLLLLEPPLDIDIMDANGHTPYDIAVERRREINGDARSVLSNIFSSLRRDIGAIGSMKSMQESFQEYVNQPGDDDFLKMIDLYKKDKQQFKNIYEHLDIKYDLKISQEWKFNNKFNEKHSGSKINADQSFEEEKANYQDALEKEQKFYDDFFSAIQIQGKNNGLVADFLKNGGDINHCRDKKDGGDSPLGFALKCGNYEVAKQILDLENMSINPDPHRVHINNLSISGRAVNFGITNSDCKTVLEILDAKLSHSSGDERKPLEEIKAKLIVAKPSPNPANPGVIGPLGVPTKTP